MSPHLYVHIEKVNFWLLEKSTFITHETGLGFIHETNCFYIFQFQLPVPIFISHIWLTLCRNEILTEPTKGYQKVITSKYILTLVDLGAHRIDTIALLCERIRNSSLYQTFYIGWKLTCCNDRSNLEIFGNISHGHRFIL